MKHDITIPQMGESITEATVGEILKSSGSFVKVDEEVIELETDKVNQVLYAPASGEVQLSVKKGDVVKMGQVIGCVDSERQAPQKSPEKEEKKESKEEIQKPENLSPNLSSKPSEKTTLKQEPKEKAVRVQKSDFIDELKDPNATQEVIQKPQKNLSSLRTTERRVPMSRMRQVIAKRLVEAQRTTAMLTTFNEVDMSAVMRLRSAYKEAFEKKHGVKLGLMSFFVKAAVAALQEIPELNASIDGTDIVYRDEMDIGIGVSTERGLIVPVVRSAQNLSFSEIEKAIFEYAQKAREGKLSVEDLQGGSFTLTNGGVYGSLLSTPIINPPQSGILGMHKIEKRPVAEGDETVIKSMMYIALSYDHRIVDGKEAVTFLVKVKEALEDPARLLLEI